MLKLLRIEVESHLKHPSPDVQDLAQRWIEKHDEVRSLLQEGRNVLGITSELLTLDSQLIYQLEEEE